MTATEVIGIGQDAAGDDAVGLAVLRRLRDEGVPAGVRLVEATDPGALVDRLQAPGRVILVDAAVGPGPAGEVLTLEEGALADHGIAPLSSHGISLAQAIALARALSGDVAGAEVRIVAVLAPGTPRRFEHGLSPEVANAVPRAVLAVRALIAEVAQTNR